MNCFLANRILHLFIIKICYDYFNDKMLTIHLIAILFIRTIFSGIFSHNIFITMHHFRSRFRIHRYIDVGIAFVVPKHYVVW